MFIIYNIFFTLLYLILWILAKICNFFKIDAKFANAINQRTRAHHCSLGTEAISKLAPSLELCIENARPTILVHSASMGEFEQAKPIIEKLKKEQPDIKIVCSFYSPSGYETQKEYEFADIVCYLPSDTYFAAKKFIKTIKPDLVIFVRYDLWYNHLKFMKLRYISVLLINATFPSSLRKLHNKNSLKSIVLKYFYKKHFNMVDYIYTISKNEYNLFKSLELRSNLILSSDTRNDRILQKVHESQQNPLWNKELFSLGELVLVAGSTWNNDVDIINSAMKLYETWRQNDKNLKKIRLILVPHEPTKKNIEYVLQNTIWPDKLTFCLFEETLNPRSKPETAILVDKIGYLLRLYGIADIAFVGGGFSQGVHSITEPAGYGLPIITGPNCYNSPFAKPLVKLQVMTVIEDAKAIANWLKEMNSDEERSKIATRARKYIQSQSGTTSQITELVLKHIRQNEAFAQNI